MNIDRIYRESMENDEIKGQTALGFCREWTHRIMIFIRRKFPNVKVEAREVDITANLQHTFIRIIDDEEEPYLYDGVGTARHKPFFGPESKAPEHLQNSKPDIINRYI